MSTCDVPGANPANGDSLGCGCWAEHKDGSLLLVEGSENNRVIYSVFDMSRKPPVEYRDAMPRVNFEKQFSRNLGGNADSWIWHDKSPFPWDRIIKADVKDGTKAASAKDVLNAAQQIIESQNRFAKSYDDLHYKVDVKPASAAQRVADELHLKGQELDADRFAHRVDIIMSRVGGIIEKFADAFARMPQAKKPAAKRKSR